MDKRTESQRPLVANRADLDAMVIVSAGKGTARDRDRATIDLHNRVVRIERGLAERFEALRIVVSRLEARDDALAAWLSLPWYRRIFHRPPALAPLQDASQQAAPIATPATGTLPDAPVVATDAAQAAE